jgi:hypothetical protein
MRFEYYKKDNRQYLIGRSIMSRQVHVSPPVYTEFETKNRYMFRISTKENENHLKKIPHNLKNRFLFTEN